LAFDLAWTMLVTRLQETSLRGEAPFWDASFAANPLVNGQRSPGVAANTTPEDLAETTEILLSEVQRARLHGFSQSELDRAIEDLRGDVQLSYDERGTTQDRQFADDYAQGFLTGTAVPSADDWHDLQMRLLDEMTTDQVWNTFGAELDTTEPFVIAVAPQRQAAMAPDEAMLRDIVSRVESTDFEPWIDDTTTLDTLMERPPPADVTTRGLFSDTYLTVITLSNGARVVFLPTTIRDDVVIFQAVSPGGWAPLPPGDVAEAQMVADIVATSGVGDIDQVTLDRSLAGRVVSLTPYFDEVEEGFYGETATRDVETLLQLVHLYMTAPRFEQVGLGIAVAATLPYASDPGQIPDLAVAIATADARFSGDVRFGPIPTQDDLLTLDLERAGEIFRDHFDDPGDFVFVFTGDFDESEVEDLSRSYLGTIPGPGDVGSWVDVRPDPPSGIVREVVEAGTGELGGLTFLFSTETALDPDRRIAIDLLELVLQQRLTDRIREQLSASYSPYTYVDLVEEPTQGVELWIEISGDPADLDDISTQTLEVLADLRSTGPTADELAIASEQLLRDYELISNEALSEAIIFSAMHPNEDLSEIQERISRTFEPTPTEIRNLARVLLPADRYIEVRLVPEGN
jgi:zinc protease